MSLKASTNLSMLSKLHIVIEYYIANVVARHGWQAQISNQAQVSLLYLTSHKFKDKIVKNFRMSLVELLVNCWAHTHEPTLKISFFLTTKHKKNLTVQL